MLAYGLQSVQPLGQKVPELVYISTQTSVRFLARRIDDMRSANYSMILQNLRLGMLVFASISIMVFFFFFLASPS